MISVIIERHIADDFASYYENVCQEILSFATDEQGFICGESLQNAYDDNHRVVIAQYRSIQDWQIWHSSEQRHQIMAKLSPMLQSDEKITILQHRTSSS